MSHPPHLRKGSTASAFIPFCAFEGKLTISNKPMWLPNLSFPICRSFVPTSLDGQRCYKLQVNKTTEGSKNREGLLLVVDMNEDMQIPFNSQNKHVGNTNALDFSSNLMTQASANEPRIHINTLSSYEALGFGSYRMTSVKKLIGKGGFLSMSNADRKCSLEDYRECKMKSLFERCQCVPAELGSTQVVSVFNQIMKYFF